MKQYPNDFFNEPNFRIPGIVLDSIDFNVFKELDQTDINSLSKFYNIYSTLKEYSTMINNTKNKNTKEFAYIVKALHEYITSEEVLSTLGLVISATSHIYDYYHNVIDLTFFHSSFNVFIH